MSRGRAYRRAKQEREVGRARRIACSQRRGDDERLIQKLATDRCLCSCALCSYYTEPPLSEVRARISEKEQRRENS